jgi:hypothetical protein
MNMRSIKNRLLLKGRKNKKTIITILLALVIVADTSDAFNFRIDHKDVAIAVNKDIAGNQVPDDKGTVGIATNSILMVEAKGCHIRVDGYLWRRFGILYEILLQNRHNGPAVETRKGMESIVSVREYLIVHPNLI